MDAKLKKCPHCGSAAELEDHRTVWAVKCTSTACATIMLGERAPEPDGEMGDAYWDSIKQTAIDRWNARAIAPPVAAGSVELIRLHEMYHDMVPHEEGEYVNYDNAIAWGAQQREAEKLKVEQSVVLAVDQAHQRAKEAEADLATYVAQSEIDFTQMEGVADQWKNAAAIAEARVKELEAELDIELERAYDRLLAARASKQAARQALQAEGKHPAPCARHCEANAFQIEARRLEAESAHKQSIIDRLMLEYCPDEMTADQTAEWEKHQVRAEVQHHPV